MFTKSVSLLEYSDIDDLIRVQNEREGYSLDYKVSLGNPDKAKKELAKDVSAFANSGGGYLIIGVNNDYVITGVERTIQNKGIDEWINQVLNSNVEPTLFYFDPKIIPVPGSEKVIVVIHIPESAKKPHIVTEGNNYFIRINDSSKTANHTQIRDMFELSNRRFDEFNDFLAKRNLLDEENENFGLNKNSKRLISELKRDLDKPKPLILFSLIPNNPKRQKMNLPFKDLYEWLGQNSKGYSPAPDHALYYAYHDYDSRLDGIVLHHKQNNNLRSYFEVLDTGYVEAGFSDTFVRYNTGQESKNPDSFISLTPILVYEMMLLGFARKFYRLIKYNGEVMMQISVVNTLGFGHIDIHQQYRMNWFKNFPQNTQHNNFKLTYSFNPGIITEEGIKMIAKHHSEQLCRVFGLTENYCFYNDNLDMATLRHFYL